MNSDKWEAEAAAQKLCCGFAAASSRYARQDLRCAFTEHLRGVNGCLILDQFGELITCPIQEGDGAIEHEGSIYWSIPGYYPSVTSTAIIPRFRPPSRYKARNLDHFRLICNAEGFVDAVQRGMKSGCI